MGVKTVPASQAGNHRKRSLHYQFALSLCANNHLSLNISIFRDSPQKELKDDH